MPPKTEPLDGAVYIAKKVSLSHKKVPEGAFSMHMK